MHMIILHLHRIYLKLVPLGYLLKTHLKPFCQLTSQYHLPIFGNPYHMIFQIVDRMACSFYRAHAVLIPCFIASRTCFHPPSRAGRYSTGIFHKGCSPKFLFVHCAKSLNPRDSPLTFVWHTNEVTPEGVGDRPQPDPHQADR